MKNSNIENRQEIEFIKNQYFLIGFIIGIFPFFLLFFLVNKMESLDYYKETLLFVSIITAFSNAFLLRKKVEQKVEYIKRDS